MNKQWTALLLMTLVAYTMPVASQSPPDIRGPAEGSKITERSRVVWTKPKGVNKFRYRVEYGEAGNASCNANVHEDQTRRNYVSVRRFWGLVQYCNEFRFTVYACGYYGDCETGGSVSEQVTYYVASQPPQPPTLSSPGSSSEPGSFVSNDRPLFRWQPAQGANRYNVLVRGKRQTKRYRNITSSSFRPPQNDPLPDYLGKRVRWQVQACADNLCSKYSQPYYFRLQTGFGGAVNLIAPSNNAQVTAGDQLRWQSKSGAGSYQVCIKATSSEPPESGNIGGCKFISQRTSNTQQQLSNREIQRVGTSVAYWTVRACTQGNTNCTDQYEWRRIQLQEESGQENTGGTTGTVSFADDLYPLITSSCAGCHTGTNNFPQNPNRSSGCAPPNGTIPFNTSISATEMRNRFMNLKACSTEGRYEDAYGKVYVVPGNTANSGLHHKAQDSNSSIFRSQLTINGQSREVREWIQIWIQQGANP